MGANDGHGARMAVFESSKIQEYQFFGCSDQELRA